ncbi:MAG: apolipoprotein N-acyltransferase [Acidobacteriota bacterium]
MGKWALFLISGGLLCLAFPDFQLFPLAWVGLVPLFEGLSRPLSRREQLAGHFLFSLAYFGGILYWIPGVLIHYGRLPVFVGYAALVCLAVVLGLILLPFTLGIHWLAQRRLEAAVWAAPGLWLLTELIRDAFPFGGFPWGALGYSQQPFTWILQIADLGGVYLVSSLIVLVNATLWLAWRKRRQSGPTVAATAGLFVLACLYGCYRAEIWEQQPVDTVRVGIVQGNIALHEGPQHYAQKYFKTLAGLFDQAVAAGATWIVFPEAQNPYRLEYDFYFRQFWSDRTAATGTYLLLNSAAVEADGYYNSAYLLDPAGRIVYRYDKIHLVPFGEYLPLEWLFGRAEALVAEVSSFRPGRKLTLGKIGTLRFSTLICYEAIFPRQARRMVGEGAHVLVNITNDGWFGATAAPAQHLQIAAVRAVETRRPLIRAANTGCSAFVSPLGKIEVRSDLFEEAVLVRDVAGTSSVTLFLVLGFAPCALVIMVSGGLGLLAARRVRD